MNDTPLHIRVAETLNNLDSVNENEGKAPSLNDLKATLDDLRNAPLSPRCIVDYYLYADVAMLVAPGGTGKTTIVLYEMVCIALGRNIWGLDVVTTGKTLLITAKDSLDTCRARLYLIIQSLNLTSEEIETILDNVFIWDVSGERMNLIHSEKTIGLTATADEIIAAYKDEPIQVVTFDPTVSFGASEQAVNDNEQGLINAARRIRNGLNCCVRYIHHTGQAVARAKTTDQYASRGGTALPDGCRMVAVLQPWDPKDEQQPPVGCNLRDSHDSITVLHRPKLSFVRPNLPAIWIRRNGYQFDYFVEQPPLTKDAKAKAVKFQVLQFITSKVAAGVYLTRNDIESGYLEELSLKRTPARKAIAQLTAEGLIVNINLPDDLKQGGRKTYLAPTSPDSEIPLAR